MKKYIFVFLICFLLIGLFAGCGQKKEIQPEYAACAGIYTCLGYYIEEQFVVEEEMSGWSVTLKEDSTGSLYWGKDNNGPISEWSINGDKLVIHAGVSVIEGAISEGVMLLDMGDGIVLGFASSNTNFDQLTMTTMELFLDSNSIVKEKNG